MSVGGLAESSNNVRREKLDNLIPNDAFEPLQPIYISVEVDKCGNEWARKVAGKPSDRLPEPHDLRQASSPLFSLFQTSPDLHHTVACTIQRRNVIIRHERLSETS
jgi:hypothetical protein